MYMKWGFPFKDLLLFNINILKVLGPQNVSSLNYH